MGKVPLVARVADLGGTCSTCKLWDTVLDLGSRHTVGIQAYGYLIMDMGQ